MEDLNEKYHSPSTFHTMLGVMLNRLNRTEAAIAEYRRAIELDPRCAEAYLNWGALLEDSGKMSEAREKYQLALQAEPDNPALKALMASMQPAAVDHSDFAAGLPVGITA